MRNDFFIVGIGMADREYRVNGVKYIVSSRFASDTESETLSDRLQTHIKSPFAELTLPAEEAIFEHEYACSTAGEED